MNKRKEPHIVYKISNEHAVALLRKEKHKTRRLRRINRELIRLLDEGKLVACMLSNGEVTYIAAKKDPGLKARQTYLSSDGKSF